MPRDRLIRLAGATAITLLFPLSATASADLLGSSHGGSAQWDFCYGQPDSTPLPPDPRSLVQPGVNDGKAVHFNAFWRDCHVDPEAVQEEGVDEHRKARIFGEKRALSPKTFTGSRSERAGRGSKKLPSDSQVS